MNEILFWRNPFEQKFVLLHALLNQGELSDHCSFNGLNEADFNLRCLSNAKRLFSETLSPKKSGQVRFDKKVYQYTVLVSFTATPHDITTNIYNG